jgi:hypothetical protein
VQRATSRRPSVERRGDPCTEVLSQ